MKKRYEVQPKHVLTWLSRGFGQGVGSNYIPYLHVRDVPSRGRSCIFYCPKTGRLHHYLSDLEFKVHILAAFSIKVKDIREQFALLPWLRPYEIAGELGIKYPVYPRSYIQPEITSDKALPAEIAEVLGIRCSNNPLRSTPIVMTSDNVLTLYTTHGTKYVVISVKPSSELDPENKKTRRTLEKLLIEKTFWDRHNIQWELITEKDICDNRYYNLSYLRPGHVAWELNWLDDYLPEFTIRWGQFWDPFISLNAILDLIASRLKLTRYYCHMLFARSVWRHLIAVDLDSFIIRHDSPVRLLSSPAHQINIESSTSGIESSILRELLGTRILL
jgi:hypothetical protein